MEPHFLDEDTAGIMEAALVSMDAKRGWPSAFA